MPTVYDVPADEIITRTVEYLKANVPEVTPPLWVPFVKTGSHVENTPKNLDWWFKNGDRDTTFFAVPYKNEETKPFYVDFIVMLKDKRIGLFDTKSGITRRVAGSKVEGLYNYIKKENKKGKKLFGGIVTNTNPRNFRGRWIYFDKSGRELRDDDLSNWKNLEL